MLSSEIVSSLGSLATHLFPAGILTEPFRTPVCCGGSVTASSALLRPNDLFRTPRLASNIVDVLICFYLVRKIACHRGFLGSLHRALSRITRILSCFSGAAVRILGDSLRGFFRILHSLANVGSEVLREAH